MAEVEGLTRLSPESPLAQTFARDRERFNARVALARRQGRRLDDAALAEHLVVAVAPAVAAAARADPQRMDAVVEALFDLSLDLVSRELVGPAARHPYANLVWRDLLPALGRPLAQAPRQVAAALTNAACAFELAATARFAQWVQELAGLAPECANAAELLECGKVLAWQAGLAHFRESALETWSRLPEPLRRRTLGLTADATVNLDELRRALADPWRDPRAPAARQELCIVGEVGGFRGFGGPFLTPPRVFRAGRQVWAADVENAWTLHADRFGATLVRAPAPPPKEEGADRAAQVGADGSVRFRGLTAHLPALSGPSGFANDDWLLAVCLPRTHTIVLVACAGAER